MATPRKKADSVNDPAHYTQGNVHCIDAMLSCSSTEAVMNYCHLACFKYLWRFQDKNGLEDLKKAQWYLNKLVELSTVG